MALPHEKLTGGGASSSSRAGKKDAEGKKREEKYLPVDLSKKVGFGEGSQELNKAEEKTGAKRKRNGIPASTGDAVNSKDGEEEEEEAVITKHARKKMRLEVEVKKKEMRSLKQKKEAAVYKERQIYSKLENVRRNIDNEKVNLEYLKLEEKSSMEQADYFDRHIRELQKTKEKELLHKIEIQKLAKASQAKISQKEEEEKNLKLRHEGAQEEVKKVEEEIVKLPSAPGPSQEVLDLIKDQIKSKKRDLECPVCFEECSPPIYTCQVQHPVCASCR